MTLLETEPDTDSRALAYLNSLTAEAIIELVEIDGLQNYPATEVRNALARAILNEQTADKQL